VRVYVETDPVFEQIRVAEGDRRAIQALEEHTQHFPYGETLGQPDCPISLEKFAWRTTRPPVIPGLWDARVNPAAERFTTVATWKNVGKDIRFRGETYYSSKHMNFLRMADLPRRTRQPLELALEVDDEATRDLLARNGWLITSAFEASRDLVAYQRHIERSRGEFTASKDLVVRTRSGWFSDRSVCYLAAGKPVITQDTGFGKFVPTGTACWPSRPSRRPRRRSTRSIATTRGTAGPRARSPRSTSPPIGSSPGFAARPISSPGRESFPLTDQ
jgi:hypothetical protein